MLHISSRRWAGHARRQFLELLVTRRERTLSRNREPSCRPRLIQLLPDAIGAAGCPSTRRCRPRPRRYRARGTPLRRRHSASAIARTHRLTALAPTESPTLRQHSRLERRCSTLAVLANHLFRRGKWDWAQRRFRSELGH